MSRSRAATATAVVVSIAVIGAAMWGLAKWQPFEHEHESVTIDWPRNVQPLVDYIEDVSDLKFVSLLDFEFIGEVAEYNERARDPHEKLTVDDQAAVAIDEAVGRALGFWASDTSLIESSDIINRATPRPARWLPDADLVLIHADDDKSTLPPAVRADLVVYLTQALIEQHFQLIERRRATDSSQEYEALAALHIGYALWVHDQYVDDMNGEDRERYESETAEQGQEYTDAVESVPATYRATRIAFQVLGPTFVTALAEDDKSLLPDALRTHIPVALDQISLPVAKYLRDDATEPVATPPGPRAAKVHYDDQLGPFRLFLMFATGLPANEALTASDGWGNDRFSAYELDGRVCVDVHVVADSPVDADRLQRAMNNWALARPSVAGALVGRDGVDLYASVCDPGTDTPQSTPTDDEIEQYFARADLLRQQAATTGKPALAECVATEFFAAFTFEQMTTESLARELEAAFTALEDECRYSL